jgi:hypothetical protein
MSQDHRAEHVYMSEDFMGNAIYPDDAHPRLTQQMIAHLARFHGLRAEDIGNVGLVLLLAPHDAAHGGQDVLGIENASDRLQKNMASHRKRRAGRAVRSDD